MHEMKHSLEGVNSRSEPAGERFRYLGDHSIEIIQSKQQRKERIKKNEKHLREQWDTTECTHVAETTKGDERAEGAEKIFEEIKSENFPNMMKNINLNTWQAQ